MPVYTPCPRCEKIGLVRKEHVITGTSSRVVFDCGWCDHQWSVTEQPPPLQPLSQTRSQSCGPKRD